MMGISEVAALNDYDVLVTLVFDHDISRLEKIVRNHKVDGVILGRTLMKDRRTEFLKESEIPFVVIGSTPVDGVIQVDNDHIEACKELTSILVMKGIRKFVLIGGGLNHVVNQTRYNGFMQALKDNNIDIDEDDIYTDITGGSDFGGILDEILRKGTECIVCMDDAICIRVLERCRNDGISIPKDIKVASFYNSPILSNYQPAITCLQYDPKELGCTACKVLLDYIDGQQVEEKKLLGYEVMLKGSTN
jgi:DNA-binding LacI/PurR family transcriptional regulator